ncbi:PorP/SprF family type IX secretion system membrane protein [Flavobacterium sp. LPB0248]|uniref:PorP/SprF family type IX secretion system membrane protein n=1 Tax=Flavobacterium sp. LPB0248 TaxID=2614441 RepID=UPI0015A5D6ED|nr:PorP/SprF family type IX secretion system membrane protein [Flavobacterium sp. LPB0248]QLC66336.1 PorP/SprF family type IX secretion system membrane protein [Flavobacterium sp. LPB0248]
MKKTLLLLIFLFVTIYSVYSQNNAEHDGIVSFYMPTRNSLKFNRYTINPTFSFVREQNSYLSFYSKRQWVQFDNAPQTYLFSYAGRFRENEGIGLGLFQQNYGLMTSFGIIGNFAHNVMLQEDSNLTFGANVGFYNSKLNQGKIITNDINLNVDNIPSNSLLAINPGINYGNSFLDVGLSVNNLLLYNFKTSQIVKGDPEKAVEAHLIYTNYINSYGFFDRSKFSGMLKTEFKKDKTVISGLAMFSVPKGFWVQGGYNNLYGISAGLGINITPKIAIEYNYEREMGNLSNLGAAHEFVIAYRFKSKKYYYGDDDETGIINPSDSPEVLKKNDAQKEAKNKLAVENKAKADAEAKSKLLADKAKNKLAAENKAKAEIEAKNKLAAEKKAKADAEAKAKLEANNAKAEMKAKNKLAQENKAKADAEAKAKLVADKAQAEMEAKNKAAEEKKAKASAEAKAKLEAANAKAEMKAQDKLAAENKAKAEIEAKNKLAEEKKVKADAEVKAKLEADNAKAEMKAKNKLAAESKAKADAEAKAKLVADKAQAEMEAKNKAAVEKKAKADAEAKAKLEADNAKAEMKAKDKLAAENKVKAEMEAKNKAAVEKKAKADAEAKAKLEADNAKAEMKAKNKLAAESKAKADAEAKAKLVADKAQAEMEAKNKLAVEKRAKSDAEAKAKLDADNAKAEMGAKNKLAVENRAKSDAEGKAKLEADNAKAEMEAQNKLQAVNKAKSDAEAKAKLEADNTKAEMEAQNKLQAVNKAKSDAETKVKLEADNGKAEMEEDNKAKGNIGVQTRLTADNAKADAVLSQLIIDRDLNKYDGTKSIDDLMSTLQVLNRNQASLLSRLNQMAVKKGDDIDELKNENDLKFQGAYRERDIPANSQIENNEIEVLKKQLTQINKVQEELLINLVNLYNEKLKKGLNKNDAQNKKFLSKMEALKKEQQAIETNVIKLINSLEK